MNRRDVEQQAIDLLCQGVLRGAGREIQADQPLGEQGLGLDSLALAEFITALENRFELEFEDEIWSARDQLTLGKLVDLIAGPEQEERPRVRSSSRLRYWLTFVTFQRETVWILERDLANGAIPEPPLRMDLEFKVGSMGEMTDFERLYPPSKRRRKRRRFRERLSRGMLCLTARHEGELVGVDWLARERYHDPVTGLDIELAEDSCLGLDLVEHREYLDQGIGFALLCYSLREAKRQGLRRQSTLVSERNTRMLSSCLQLLGFEKRGEIRIIRILGRPHSSCRAGARTDARGALLL
jgi:acyl carrier protein/GNAT superfamily N-acetyltransferase